MQLRVLVLGAGDLGQRIARGLIGAPEIGELVLAGRRDSSLAALLGACGEARVRFAAVDAHRPGDVERLLRVERPDLLLQCAVEVSPWWVSDRSDPFWEAVHRAGFAVQLPLQLPLLMRVMEAVRSVDFRGLVVNASYPDLTHPILAARGLAPSIGVGNAGMIERQVRAVLRERGFAAEPVRVAAHHAHVTPMVQGRPPKAPATRPRVYLGEDGGRADELAFAGSPLPADRRLNELSAAAAVPLIRAFAGSRAVRCSTPAPMGLPGGWPVRVSANHIELDLPPGAEREELIAFQWESARSDGVARVDADGTVHFTEEARAALGRWGELAEPLPIDEMASRRELLMAQC